MPSSWLRFLNSVVQGLVDAHFRPWGFLLILISASSLSSARAADWPFNDELNSRLVWVHPLVNYAINPVWQRQWEKNLVAGNGLQITSGSVSTEDLSTQLQINISEPLNDTVGFIYRSLWSEGLHLDQDLSEHWLGFELTVNQPISVHLQVNPTGDKEYFDLLAGLLLTDASRHRFLKLSLRFDDFLYERKNDLGGKSDQEPISVQWELRHQLGHWELFSTGRYGSESRRTYPDSDNSPGLAATRHQSGGSNTTLRYLLSDESFLALGAEHYRFEAGEVRRNAVEGFDYANEFLHLSGLAVLHLTKAWWLRPEVHWLRQWTSADGRRQLEHRREDFFPALYVELRAPGRSTWELGYLATDHCWNQTVSGWEVDYGGYTDKIELGWIYSFRPETHLQFSLSHELDLSRFGGGNVQFQTLF